MIRNSEHILTEYLVINCQLGDEDKIGTLKEEARLLSESGVNFLLLETTFNSLILEEYNIVGQLEIKDLGNNTYISWFDYKNSEELEIEISCK